MDVLATGLEARHGARHETDVVGAGGEHVVVAKHLSGMKEDGAEERHKNGPGIGRVKTIFCFDTAKFSKM